MMYISQELPETDLTRMKNDPVYRSRMVESMTRTLATTLDCELFDIQIASAAGRKGAIIEMDIPRNVDPIKNNLFTEFSYLGNEIEQTVNQYYIGINRREINMTVTPNMHTQLIRSIPSGTVIDKKVLDWIQNNQLDPAYVAGLYVIRHPLLGINVPSVATNDFGHYYFKGIKAIINHVSSAWIQLVFNSTNGVINKDTGNYRMIQRIVWGKGLVYGDLVKVIKEPSTKDNPFEFETNLIEHRKTYNTKYGFQDWGIEIPETLEELQESYRTIEIVPKETKNPKEPVSHTPSGWNQEVHENINVKYQKGSLTINDQTCWKAGEDWGNREGGIENHKNWFNFIQEFGDSDTSRIINFSRLILWTTTSIGYKYCVPVSWTLTNIKNKKKEKQA